MGPEARGILGPQAGLQPKSPALGANGGSVVKESTCNARDLGLIPGSGRSLGEGMATHSSILAWKIPWTEKSGRLQFMGSQRVGND